MISLLHILSYVGGIAAFLFVTLSLASGLLWLAELIEEHSRSAKAIGMRMIYGVIILHILLFAVDRLPLFLILFSIVCHVVYLQNFTPAWPYMSLTSPRFLLSCALVITDHFLWFFHFAEKSQESKRYRPGSKYRYGAAAQKTNKMAPTFMDVAAFFAVCVWMVPLFLFLSLSANDNVLPSLDNKNAPGTPSGGPTDGSMNIGSPNGKQPRTSARTSLLKSILNPILSLLPHLRRRGRSDEGLLAPRTPMRGSPSPSPSFLPPTAGGGYSPWGNSSELAGTPTGAYGSPGGGGLMPNRPMHMQPPPPRRSVSEYSSSSYGGGPPPRVASPAGLQVEGMGGVSGEGSSMSRSASPSHGVASSVPAHASAPMRRMTSGMEGGRAKDD